MAETVYEERMGDSDALAWTIERDPLLRSTIVSVWVLDRMPDAGNAVRDRHGAYYAAALETWATDVKGSRQWRAWAEMDAEIDVPEDL